MSESKPRVCRLFSAEEKALMLDQARQGHGPTRIAAALGRHTGSVQNWIKRNAPATYREVARQEVRRALDANPGLTNREIARRLCCSPDLVNRVRGKRHKTAATRRRRPAPPRDAHHKTRPAPLASPLSWLDQPPGRIIAQRQAQGVQLP